MRLGIFGGTFDPIHVGHLLVASDAHETLELDRLLLVPAAQQPFKAHAGGAAPAPEATATPAADRVEMVRRAVAGDPRFEVSTVEIERGGLSFTVDTLSELARDDASERFLLVGADVLTTFAQWRQPDRILQLATLAIIARPGMDDATTLWDRLLREWHTTHGQALQHKPIFLKGRRVDVSSTEIRARVRSGRSIHGFVPDAVAAWIAERGLYSTRLT